MKSWFNRLLQSAMIQYTAWAIYIRCTCEGPLDYPLVQMNV